MSAMLNSPGPAEVETLLKAALPDGSVSVEKLYDVSVVTVDLAVLHRALTILRDSGYRFLTSCHGMNVPGSDNPFGMVYHLHDLPRNLRIRVKAWCPDDPPVFPTVTNLFPSANWMEREAYDFFGFRFDGHPDLRRILNMDDMVGWPLRKEYPLEDPARFDKDDNMFGR